MDQQADEVYESVVDVSRILQELQESDCADERGGILTCKQMADSCSSGGSSERRAHNLLKKEPGVEPNGSELTR